MMEMQFKRITNGQVKQIAETISKRWKFVNHGSYYNCIDTKTRQSSNQGGDYNFATLYFHHAVESEYLKLIGEQTSYLDWQMYGVPATTDRKTYIFCIEWKVIELLCGFKDSGRDACYERLISGTVN